MRANYERAYDVGFLCLNDGDSFHKARSIVRKLGLSIDDVDLDSLRTEDLSYQKLQFHRWKNDQFFHLRRETLDIVTFGGDDMGTPKRVFAPAQCPLLLLQTNCRELVDYLLDDACLPYQFLRIYLHADFPKNTPIDWIISTNTGLFLVNRRDALDAIEIHCVGGMHQAHDLFRLPILIQLMGNTWTLTALGGIGWAAQNLSEVNRRHQRGNELLQRSK